MTAAVRILPWAILVASASGSASLENSRPRVDHREAAVHPVWARGAGLVTSVELRVEVAVNGRARRVVVVPYSVKGDMLSRRLRASFDSAAVAAVKRWTFRPARRGGRPIAAWTRVTVPFEDPGDVVSPDTSQRARP